VGLTGWGNECARGVDEPWFEQFCKGGGGGGRRGRGVGVEGGREFTSVGCAELGDELALGVEQQSMGIGVGVFDACGGDEAGWDGGGVGEYEWLDYECGGVEGVGADGWGG